MFYERHLINVMVTKLDQDMVNSTNQPQEDNKQLSRMTKKSQQSKLYNWLTKEDAEKKLLAENQERTTISFYRYFPIKEPQVLRDEMFINFDKLGVLGRVYLAHEGINAQISIPNKNVSQFKDYLDSIVGLKDVRLNFAIKSDNKSFWALKIKVREKIVADGICDQDFDMKNRGHYVSAEEFNLLTKDPDVAILDMRNHYEYEIGHFENAIEVPSETFREQLPMAVDMMKENKNKKIIMYCTGGIRCEKASAWMLHKGFKEVYHLEGGIIKYANDVKEKGLENKFRGKNFVFDNRLGEPVGDEIIAHCHQCGALADTHTNCANDGCHLLFIQCESCKLAFENCCCKECQEIINLPKEEQKILRKGNSVGAKIFNKSKGRLNRFRKDS